MTGDVVPQRPTMAQVSRIADDIVVTRMLEDYREKKSFQTLRRQRADLALFSHYLQAACIQPGDFFNELSSWYGVSFGLIEGFKKWMLDEGYSIGSINVRVATVRRYCDMAFRAGYIDKESHALIKTVKGITGNEARNVDEKRDVVRNGHKKAQATSITYEEAEALKRQDNPRDALLMCLLIDHGLRCGEVANLRIDNFDLSAGELRFYRHKVNKWQTHKLSHHTLEAASKHIEASGVNDRVFVGEGEDGAYVERSVNKRVAALGKQLGIVGLSPHDLRHYWATRALKRGSNIKSVQQAGGWRSPYMPLRYAEETEIANEGIIQ